MKTLYCTMVISTAELDAAFFTFVNNVIPILNVAHTFTNVTAVKCCSTLLIASTFWCEMNEVQNVGYILLSTMNLTLNGYTGTDTLSIFKLDFDLLPRPSPFKLAHVANDEKAVPVNNKNDVPNMLQCTTQTFLI